MRRWFRLAAFTLVVTLLGGLLQGCSAADSGEGQADSNTVFKDFYSGVTGTIQASDSEGTYRWLAAREPFPLKSATWKDTYPSSCDNEGNAKLKITTDTFDQGIDNPDFQRNAEKVEAYWKSRGWPVRNIAHGKKMISISTEFGDGIKIVYDVGRYGEQIVAYTKCYAFFGENSTEKPEEYPGEKVD